MTLLVSPDRCDLTQGPLVFLAGSIEMGVADHWQVKAANTIEDVNSSIIVANPRREEWDASWAQTIDNENFFEQVNWELDHIELADLVVFYFQPGTQSPITLLELGKHLERVDVRTSTLVCCPDGFWRKGNIEVACHRKGLPAPLQSLDALLEAMKRWAENQKRITHTSAP